MKLNDIYEAQYHRQKYVFAAVAGPFEDEDMMSNTTYVGWGIVGSTTVGPGDYYIFDTGDAFNGSSTEGALVVGVDERQTKKEAAQLFRQVVAGVEEIIWFDEHDDEYGRTLPDKLKQNIISKYDD